MGLLLETAPSGTNGETQWKHNRKQQTHNSNIATHIGDTTATQWKHNGTHRKHNGNTMETQWDTSETQQKHNGHTMETQWKHNGNTTETQWKHNGTHWKHFGNTTATQWEMSSHTMAARSNAGGAPEATDPPPPWNPEAPPWKHQPSHASCPGQQTKCPKGARLPFNATSFKLHLLLAQGPAQKVFETSGALVGRARRSLSPPYALFLKPSDRQVTIGTRCGSQLFGER